MRTAGIFIFFTMLSVTVLSQQQYSSDSIFFYKQATDNFNFVKRSATQLNTFGLKRLGMVQLETAHEKGSFRRAQQAHSNTTTDFYSEGMATLGRWKVSGSFHFNKIWEDSLAYSLKGTDDDAQPYYFFAGKAGKYERQNYNMSTIASYELIKDRLYLSGGIQFDYHWTTRSVDPRPEVKYFKFLFSPEISYRFKNNYLGASLDIGYGRETNSIDYKNRNYAGNQTFIERNIFLSLGYGHIGKLPGFLNRYSDYSGFKIHYAGEKGKYLIRTSLSYLLWEEENSRVIASAKNHDVYSILQADTYEAAILIQKKGGNNQQQLQATLHRQTAINWSSEFNATSYQYLNTNVSVGYLYLFKGRKIEPELGVDLVYNDLLREDVVDAHYINYKYFQPGISFSLYSTLRNGNRLMVNLRPSLRIPVDNIITIPATQVNYFTKGVVYTDYLYWDARALQQDIAFKYNVRDFYKLSAGFYIKAAWLHRLAASQSNMPANFIPGSNRFAVNVGANLYF